MAQKQTAEQVWREFLTGESSGLDRIRKLFRFLPTDPRCKMCNSPFAGLGGVISRKVLGFERSNKNPNICNHCETFARKNPGGAEVELSMLFADVRGSTSLAEKMSASEFSQLLNRFYGVANKIFVKTDALIDKLVGDEVIGLYIPGLAGPNHARLAIQAAQELLRETGHGTSGDPWLPVGVGVHTGTAFVGMVGSAESFADFTALGDNVNVTARLASNARQGEILVTDAAYRAAGLTLGELEHRQLELKGKSEPIDVRVLKAAQPVAATA
jgi:adenylate cyclase